MLSSTKLEETSHSTSYKGHGDSIYSRHFWNARVNFLLVTWTFACICLYFQNTNCLLCIFTSKHQPISLNVSRAGETLHLVWFIWQILILRLRCFYLISALLHLSSSCLILCNKTLPGSWSLLRNFQKEIGIIAVHEATYERHKPKSKTYLHVKVWQNTSSCHEFRPTEYRE